MPSFGERPCSAADELDYDSLFLIARAAVKIGVEKIRITGGEPLVRPGVLDFLSRVRSIPGLKRLVLTTNGLLLDEMASGLKSAGVESLNISLDSLKPEIFAGITGGGDVNRVLRGIRKAGEVGFASVKINVVAMRGVNDDEIADFAALTVSNSFKVRFIEYMPVFEKEGDEALVISGAEILDKLSGIHQLQEVPRELMDGPAIYRKIVGAKGEVGIITPVSCHFCNDCNRIRVTSDGKVKGCLFNSSITDLNPYLESLDEDAVARTLRTVACSKPERHLLTEIEKGFLPFSMAEIGG